LGTLCVGSTRTTAPFSSGSPSVRTSETNFPICLGGKFTTAITRFPKSSSLVLQRPETPLHNNSSETCARAAKIKLKISGSTRSELGQKVRDTFLSLKQTCLKLGINFIAFLRDRVRGEYAIPRLATIISERALAATTDPPMLPMPKNVLQLGCQQPA
jgi:hypothetical protein